jgi:prepilin-type N-terminal cleavage/methylation domain-containing protein/prepilin-type processing-associated H-X9-DG protein
MLSPCERLAPSARIKHIGRGFTLVELLVVVSIIALLVAILLPSLTKARKQAMTVVCLSNIRAMGTGVTTYAAEYAGSLPGPLHPGAFRNMGKGDPSGKDPTEFQRQRQLVWKLRDTFRDRSALVGGTTDKLSTCPVMEQLVPLDAFFRARTAVFGTGSTGGVYPVHYCINNWGGVSSESSAPDPTNSYPRATKPSDYFGLSPADGGAGTAPVKVEAIPRASEEWAIADAWFRPRQNAAKYPRQEGPFQTPYSGRFMPNFGPHMRRVSTRYDCERYAPDAGATLRNQESVPIRGAKSDGLTNTAFFDGHAASVSSVRGAIGGFEIFYGFPGTVNADRRAENPW